MVEVDPDIFADSAQVLCSRLWKLVEESYKEVQDCLRCVCVCVGRMGGGGY